MAKPWKGLLLWTPRLLGILFILFLSMFALDIFGQGYSFWETVVGLFMHLLPSLALIVGIILAWRWEWVGALAFIGWGVFYIARTSNFPLSVYILLVGIPCLIGLLFLVGWIFRRSIRTAH